jgi:hypothetical protein
MIYSHLQDNADFAVNAKISISIDAHSAKIYLRRCKASVAMLVRIWTPSNAYCIDVRRNIHTRPAERL